MKIHFTETLPFNKITSVFINAPFLIKVHQHFSIFKKASVLILKNSKLAPNFKMGKKCVCDGLVRRAVSLVLIVQLKCPLIGRSGECQKMGGGDVLAILPLFKITRQIYKAFVQNRSSAFTNSSLCSFDVTNENF